jgi:glutathione S-transferase
MKPGTLAFGGGVVEADGVEKPARQFLNPEIAMPYALPALTTLVALLLYFVTIANVGRARGKYKIDAPAVTGHPDFERVHRVQMNTLEQIVAFLPALWLFAVYVDPVWSSVLGTVWIAGRALYAVAYYHAAEKRGAGFVIGFAAFAVLWLGAAWGVVQALFRG